MGEFEYQLIKDAFNSFWNEFPKEKIIGGIYFGNFKKKHIELHPESADESDEFFLSRIELLWRAYHFYFVKFTKPKHLSKPSKKEQVKSQYTCHKCQDTFEESEGDWTFWEQEIHGEWSAKEVFVCDECNN